MMKTHQRERPIGQPAGNRIQRRRVKGWRKPPNTRYVGRGTVFGNPWTVGAPHPVSGLPMGRSGVVWLYLQWLTGTASSTTWAGPLEVRRQRILAALPSLRGKRLACWCAPGEACHADVLLRLCLLLVWLFVVSPTYGLTVPAATTDAESFRRSRLAVIGYVMGVTAKHDARGNIVTAITVFPDHVIRGPRDGRPVAVHILGGTLDGVTQWVPGTAQLWGRVLVFADAEHKLIDGWSVEYRPNGEPIGFRYTQAELTPEPASKWINTLLSLREVEPWLPVASGGGSADANFTFLGGCARWCGPGPMPWKLDKLGDPRLGPERSRQAFQRALDALAAASGYRGEIVDPAWDTATYQPCASGFVVSLGNHIGDFAGDAYALGHGGYCTNGQTTTLADGRSCACIGHGGMSINASSWFGSECNLGEVMLHEGGHAIGLGHSSDRSATMAAIAHFDGRCATLRDDDKAGMRALYPVGTAQAPSTPIATVTRTPSVTRTASRTRTETPTRTASRTSTATRTRTPTITPRATRTATSLPTCNVPCKGE